MNRLSIGIMLLLSLTIASCNDDNGNGTTPLQIRLTDAPGDYESVYIDIKSISINATSDENSGWQTLNLLNPGVYDLLDFRNGMDTLLVDEDIPAGKISQIRLILGENNSVVKEGTSYPLETPSAQQSGLKLNLHADLVSGIVYRLWIDFDASRSIVETGSGKFMLKPVIRTYTEATGGTLRGIVLPAEALPYVKAIAGTDTLTTVPQTNGYFQIAGITPGEWKVVLDAADGTTYKDSVINNVRITMGAVTDLGTITLIKQ